MKQSKKLLQLALFSLMIFFTACEKEDLKPSTITSIDATEVINFDNVLDNQQESQNTVTTESDKDTSISPSNELEDYRIDTGN